MSFNPNRPVTVSNCPTRAALERKPGDAGFLVGSINARHTAKKQLRRHENLAARALGKRK